MPGVSLTPGVFVCARLADVRGGALHSIRETTRATDDDPENG